jgi:hypothetical protein
VRAARERGKVIGCQEEVPGNLNMAFKVIAIMLLMGGFVAVCIVCSCCRSWFEAPTW